MRFLIKFATISLLACATMFSTLVYAAGQETPGVNRRERHQSRRIREGVRNGSLTRREAARLYRQQNRIRRHERRVRADGTVTARERARLQRQENRASRNIYRKKHNWRRRSR